MKKILILSIFLMSYPVYSACPVNTSGETVCSISGMQNNSAQDMNNQNMGIDINNNELTSKFIQQDSGLNKAFPQVNNPLMQYNSGCQFGICVQDLNNVKNSNQ